MGSRVVECAGVVEVHFSRSKMRRFRPARVVSCASFATDG